MTICLKVSVHMCRPQQLNRVYSIHQLSKRASLVRKNQESNKHIQVLKFSLKSLYALIRFVTAAPLLPF